MKYIITIVVAMACATMLQAQVTTKLPIDTAKQSKKNGTSLSVGSGGVKISKDRDTTDHAFEVQFGMLDLGINSIDDKTDYTLGFMPAIPNLPVTAQTFIQAPDDRKNADLFSLRTSKSINVNIYPIMVKARLYKSAGQKVTLASGIGLQLYNFRFTKPISYRADPRPGVVMDTVSFSKNKLAFNYLTVPLMINAKTKIANNKSGGYWLTYGVGVSGGYLLSSWTKQVSDERGKEKNHDPFNFRTTNFCVNGELGLDGYVRLYASYQVTALHDDALDQHPFCIGVRFLGL
jgi:hypothetical protein